MVRKDRTELLDRINAAITQLDNNYPDWRNDLWNKYYQADTGNQIAFTAEERKYINSLQNSDTTLTAIISPDRIPYSYFENGTAKGIMVLNNVQNSGYKISCIQCCCFSWFKIDFDVVFLYHRKNDLFQKGNVVIWSGDMMTSAHIQPFHGSAWCPGSHLSDRRGHRSG